MVLVGVWGWLGLSAAIWVVATPARGLAGLADVGGRPAPLERTLALVGFAHAPVLVLAVVVLVAASSFLFDLDPLIGVAVVALPYRIWLATVGRHLLQQVQHLR